MSCQTHIPADVCGGRKSLIKPVMWQKPAIILSCSVLSPAIVMHDDAYIGGRSENNIKCVVYDDLGWKNRTTRYILPRHWLYEWFSQCHRCGIYLVHSRSPSILLSMWMPYRYVWFFILTTIKHHCNISWFLLITDCNLSSSITHHHQHCKN